jgi:HEAT repeat protein
VRALRPSTVALVDEAYRFAGTEDIGAVEARLHAIAEAREPLAIPRVIGLVRHRRRAVAEAAAHAVAALRELVPVRHLSLLDHAFRGLAMWTTPERHRWRELRPEDLPAIAALAAGPALVQLAMCHPSGYVREEAIRRSAAATSIDPSTIAFLLLRTNDWVSPVRVAATQALRAWLTPENVPLLLGALPIIDAMRGWGRLGPANIVDEIESLLGHPAARGALLAAAAAPDPFVRRGAYRRLVQSDRDVIAAALRDADPAIRAWASRWLVTADDGVFLPLADELLRSRSGPIRFAAASRLRATDHALPWPMLLVDPRADVRALAQDAALDAGMEPDTEYRVLAATARGPRLGAALVGLGETGGPDDVALLRGHFASASPAARRGALQALAIIGVDDLIPLALAALADASPAVTRTARDLLITRRASLRGELVWSALRAKPSAAALSVIAALGSWESLPFLLRALSIDDAALTARVTQALSRWLTRQRTIFIPCPPPLVDELRALISASAISDDVRHDLLVAL